MNTLKLEKLALTIIYLKRIFIVGLVYLMHTALYGYVSIHHVNDNFNLLTDLDKLFPFVPEMVYLYMSFYIWLCVFFLLYNLKKWQKIITKNYYKYCKII
jgi:hypothetical protein